MVHPINPNLVFRRAAVAAAALLLAACQSARGPQPSSYTPSPDRDASALHGAAASTVRGEGDLAARRDARFEDMLRGLAGVQVFGSGSAMRVRVRGVGVTGRGDPLFVVNGVPLNVAHGPLVDAIRTYDVTKVEVLRDVADLAVYGPAGRNGVVVVTTRRAGGS